MTAIIAGATGATGKDLLNLVLNDTSFSQVEIFVRHKPDIQNSKLKTHIVDFDKTETWEHLVKGDVLFSCLGTTLKAAGSKAQQYTVDYQFQYNFAYAAKKNGVKSYVLVSSANASANSFFFYSKIKGDLEESVKKLNFDRLIIFRPPLLIRKESDRKAEVFAEKLLNFLNSIGLFCSFRPLPTEKLAQAMINSVNKFNNGIHIIEPKEILCI